MKKILTYLLGLSISGVLFLSNASAAFGGSDIIPVSQEDTIGDTTFSPSTGLLDKVLIFAKDSIFGILGLVAVGMFLYVGYSLVKAQGNPEEMKKAFMTLIHVIVGLFIVAISWALIKMVSGIIL